jgi:FkbM family methyltransferase
MTIWQYLSSFIDTLNHPFNRRSKWITIFRIIYWKINQMFFHLPAVITLDQGIKCICYPDSSYGGMVVYNRWAEYEVMKNIIRYLKPNSTYIDVGANIGDTTVIAALYTKNKIYAFEPSPVAYPRLLENVRLNNLGSQIVSEQLVVSDHDGRVKFSDMRTSETSHISSVRNPSEPSLTLKSITLDSYAQLHQISNIDLIKIDVEGAEMLVLQGASTLLVKHQIKHILVELNTQSTQYGYVNSDVVRLLKKYGYKVPKSTLDIDRKILNIHAYV